VEDLNSTPDGRWSVESVMDANVNNLEVMGQYWQG